MPTMCASSVRALFPSDSGRVTTPHSLFGLLRALALDLVLVVACMTPAAVMPLLHPALSIVLVLVAMALFLWVATRTHLASDAAGVIGTGWLRRPQVAWLWPALLLIGVMDLLLQCWYYRVMPEHSHVASALDAYEQRPLGALALALFLIAYVPVVEEFIFRRRMLGQLRSRFGTSASVVISAVLFAALHLSLWTAAFTLMSGLIFGMAVVRTRTVWTGVLLHAATNAAPGVLSLLSGSDERVDRWLDASGASRGTQALLTVVVVAATAVVLRRLVSASAASAEVTR